MRTKDSTEQIDYLRQASEADSLDEIFTGLDVLGSTPWSVNRGVFDVVTEVWNSGEALADIPKKADLTAGVAEPERPEGMETDPRAKDTYRHRMKQAIMEKRASHSNRCDVNYKLEIARAVRSSLCLLSLVKIAATDIIYDSRNSSSTRRSTFLTIWTSVVERILSLRISLTLVMTCVGVSYNSAKRNL